MNDSVLKDIVLKRSDEIERRPTVSLCLTSRLLPLSESLETVGPYIDEMVLVLVDCSENLREAFLRGLDHHPILKDKPCTVVAVDYATHPHLYRRDVPETFDLGHPLAGEKYAGPFSGHPFVADWSAVRNLGFGRCSQEWRLCLEADEVLDNPGQVASSCFLLDEHKRDLGYSNRRRSDNLPHGRSVLAGKLARNLPEIYWEGAARETLEGSLRPAVLDNFLRTTERPSPLQRLDDAEVFKILYAEARATDWAIPPVNLLHMARTARHAGMTPFAATAVDAYLANSLYPEERAWACAIRGELLEEEGDFAEASRWYERSLAEHPGWKSFYRLSRSKFREKEWQACVEAYQGGLVNQDLVQLVDDGPESSDIALVLVATALHHLGRVSEAREASKALRLLFPSSQAVGKLCETIG